MATLEDLTRRIHSVGNTKKITKAMELVAAAKLRRAQQRIETLRPYADAMVELTANVARSIRTAAPLPLLEEREVKSAAIMMFTGDRGLAGAMNANVLKRALQLQNEWEAAGANVRFIGVGKKGVGSLQFRNLEIIDAWRGITDSPKFADAQAIAGKVVTGFSNADYDKVVLVYNHFRSAASQHVVVQDLLPLTDELLGTRVSDLAAAQSAQPEEGAALTARGRGTADSLAVHQEHLTDGKYEADWFFEPDNLTLLNALLPNYVEQAIYRALLESTASEHGARMTAMRNASENAGEIIDTLTLERNRARQAEITQEILEVVAGAEALV